MKVMHYIINNVDDLHRCFKRVGKKPKLIALDPGKRIQIERSQWKPYDIPP